MPSLPRTPHITALPNDVTGHPFHPIVRTLNSLTCWRHSWSSLRCPPLCPPAGWCWYPVCEWDIHQISFEQFKFWLSLGSFPAFVKYRLVAFPTFSEIRMRILNDLNLSEYFMGLSPVLLLLYKKCTCNDARGAITICRKENSSFKNNIIIFSSHLVLYNLFKDLKQQNTELATKIKK